MQFAVIIGSIAAVASTISFAPQAWKIIRTRETKDISAVTYGFTVAAFALWSAYGLILPEAALQFVVLIMRALALWHASRHV